MHFYVMSQSYNCYGSHTTLSPIGNFLLAGCGNYGDAIKEIVVTLYLRDSGPVKESLKTLFEDHNRYRSTLPKIAYRRTSGKIEISIASEVMDGQDWKPSPTLSLPLFTKGVEEVVQALGLIRKRLKNTDDFNGEAFLSHCEEARQRIPYSEEALQELAAQLEQEDQARRAAMSPWDRLGIDWGTFIPRRAVFWMILFSGTVETISRQTETIPDRIFSAVIETGSRSTKTANPSCF